MDVVIIDCATGKRTVRKMTAGEIEQHEADVIEFEREEAEREAAEAKRREAQARVVANPAMRDLAEAMGWL